jgi:uncharacterized protein (TIGR01777 family)
MASKVLISGGSGMLGQHLTGMLQKEGYKVGHLSRQSGNKNPQVEVIQWDILKQKVEAEKLSTYDHFIHLAGAGIVDEAWTEKRKRELFDSRVKSAKLIFDTIKKTGHRFKSMVSASAVGYYGINTTSHIYTENDKPAEGFLANICVDWEKAARQFEELGIPVDIIRISTVLSTKGGALPKLTAPIRFYIGAPLGDGEQYMPWIHIDDLCRLFIFLLEKPTGEVYNGVASEHVTNKEFTSIAAKSLNRSIWLPPVPEFPIKLALGERAKLVLEGSRVSNEKARKRGFEFKYDHLQDALNDLLN